MGRSKMFTDLVDWYIYGDPFEEDGLEEGFEVELEIEVDEED